MAYFVVLEMAPWVNESALNQGFTSAAERGQKEKQDV